MLFRLIFISLLVVTGFAGSAFAQESDQSAGAKALDFPFAPPTDTILFYQLTKTEIGPHSPPERVFNQEITYHPVSNGFDMRIKTVSTSVGGRVIRQQDAGFAPMPLPEIVGVMTPITIHLDSNGRPQTISDWDKLSEFIKQLPKQISQAAPAAAQDRLNVMATNAIQPLLSLNERSAWTFIAAEWPPVLTYNGVRFLLDSPMTVPGVHALFDGAVPVKLIHNVIVTRRPGGGLTLEETQHPDQAEFEAAVTEFYDKLAKSMPPEALAARRGRDVALKLNVERTATTHIDVDDNGVLQSGYWEVRYLLPDGSLSSSEKVTFEKIVDENAQLKA